MLSIICKNVKTKLQRQIKGHVSVHFVNLDNNRGISIEVQITQLGNKIYRYYEQFTNAELSEGLVSDYIVKVVLDNYTYYIKSLYFKTY